MAQKVFVSREDDLVGGPAHETVRFKFEGVEYEIDLNQENATALRQHFARYIERARKVGREQRLRPGRASASRVRSSEIRVWAKRVGIQVSERGRIPASVIKDYVDYHNVNTGGMGMATGARPAGPPSIPPRPPRDQRAREAR